MIRPILLPLYSVNHSAPSGPAVMPGPAAGRGDREFGDRAGGRDPPDLVAAGFGEPQRAVRPRRDAQWVATARQGCVYSVITPAVVIRPILLPAYSVNHSAPSGPAVMSDGSARRDRGFGDRPGGRDPADLVAVVLGEPQRAVRPRRDSIRSAAGRRDREIR